MSGRSIESNVREVEIQRNEYLAFGTTRIEHFEVRIAAKMQFQRRGQRPTRALLRREEDSRLA
jgi:hypothetical protein